ncbi:MAG: hypothetical protein ACFFAE_17955 [Candidatus Hodarchaeota archaeon]
MKLKKIWDVITTEGHFKGLTRTPQRKIFVIKDPQTNPSLVIMDSTDYFKKANGDLFIGRELPNKDTLIELLQEHKS